MEITDSGEEQRSLAILSSVRNCDRERLAKLLLGILVFYLVLSATLRASFRPFWADEIVTLAVTRQPTVSGMWAALRHAVDAFPPPFFLLERVSGKLPINERIAFRIPSIASFCCVIISIFLVVKRRSSGLIALISAMSVAVTVLFDPFAVEARSYGLMTAFIALGLVCYQRAESRRWACLLAVCLAAAEASHYYAIFAFVPIGLAEIAFIIEARRFRPIVWVALCVGVLPLIAFWPFLAPVRAYFRTGFWAPPAISTAVAVYGWFLHWSDPMGSALAAAAALGLLGIWLYRRFGHGPELEAPRLPLHECVLIAGLLASPLVMFVVTKIVHGGFTNRYMLPGLLGFPLAIGYILSQLKRKATALVATFFVLAIIAQELLFWKYHYDSVGKFISPAIAIEELVTQAGYPELPVVLSDHHDFLQASYYASGEWSRRFVDVVDPRAAAIFAGTDNGDKNLLVLRLFSPIQVYQYESFAAAHPKFLLYSGEGDWDWWPARLLHDGDSLQLVAMKERRKVYLVTLVPSPGLAEGTSKKQ